MKLIDTHCHIDVEAFGSDRGRVIEAAHRQGVAALVVPGVEAEGFANLSRLCHDNPGLYPAFGLHPVYLHRHSASDVRELERRVMEDKPVAVGEIGLDCFIENPDLEAQKRLLEAQLGIARDAGLPILLHIRKAHDQVLSILRRMHFSGGGIAHAFNGSLQQAQQFIDFGFKLGFGGVVTFDRARKIRRLAVELPLWSMVLETDAPDLAPSWHRGSRNSPEYLPEIAMNLAELRGEIPEAIAAATTANALSLFPAIAAALDQRRN